MTARDPPPPTVLVERAGPVATVRLRNPPRNLMTPAMIVELDELTRGLQREPAIRAVVLTGDSPDAFITHFDLQALRDSADEGPRRQLSLRAAASLVRVTEALGRIPMAGAMLDRSPLASVRFVLLMHQVMMRIGRSDKVYIAAVNGLALGGGCELALACDLRYLADRPDCRIGLPEPTLGILPGAGGTQRLAHIVGASRAAELLLEGAALTPQQALELGIAHRVVAPDQLMAAAQDTARRLARRSPLSVAAVKQTVYHGATRPLTQGLRIEAAAFLRVVASEQAARSIGALLDEYPSDQPLTSAEVLRRLPEWQRADDLDLGRPA